MKRSLFWAAFEAGAKAVRSGLSTVGALVDCGIPRQHVWAEALCEKEAEEEVAEPTPSDWFRETAFNVGIDPQVVERLHRNPEAMARLAEAEATMDQAEELRLCDDCGHDDQRHATGTGPVWPCTVRGCHCYDILFIKSPAVSATDSAVEDPPGGAPPPPGADSINYRGEQLSWAEYIQPAIENVLANHQWTWHVGRIECWEDGVPDGSSTCGWFDDNQQWREHVAELLAWRLEEVTLAIPDGRNIEEQR